MAKWLKGEPFSVFAFPKVLIIVFFCPDLWTCFSLQFSEVTLFAITDTLSLLLGRQCNVDILVQGRCWFREDVSLQIIGRLCVDLRVRDEFWQFELKTFAPLGLDKRYIIRAN